MTLEMLITEPPPLSSISGIAAVISAWAVETLKRKASSNASAVVSRNGRGMAPRRC